MRPNATEFVDQPHCRGAPKRAPSIGSAGAVFCLSIVSYKTDTRALARLLRANT